VLQLSDYKMDSETEFPFRVFVKVSVLSLIAETICCAILRNIETEMPTSLAFLFNERSASYLK
jgi:hypothetical protein